MKPKLDRFTADSLSKTRSSWLTLADRLDMPRIEYEVDISWAENHINYAPNNSDSFAYGIFEDGHTEASAIVELIYSPRPGKDIGWLKMLRIKLSPAYAPAMVEGNVDKYVKVIDIYAESIVGTIVLTDVHPANVVKIYGRNEALLKLLIALNERLTAQMSDKLSTKMEGRWFVVSPI